MVPSAVETVQSLLGEASIGLASLTYHTESVMNDKMMLECVQKVETSCDWFMREHSNEGDRAKCAKGIAVVARALRSLMIVVEQTKKANGPLETQLLKGELPCGDHTHPALICFTSKGEFYMREVLPIPQTHLAVEVGSRKVTPSEMMERGVSPHELIEGIKRTMHFLVMGETATMPVARA